MKKRATASLAPGSKTGMTRYELYRNGISRIKKAINDGYYLEAITLCESLIADRLESRLKFLTGSDRYSFKTLWDLQEGIKIHETDTGIRSLIDKDLDNWRKDRNNALHAIVKLEESNIELWEERIQRCKKIANEGEKIRKEIFSKIDKLKK